MASQMPSPELLLAQADWVRELARRLVRDAWQADDVAQDTPADLGLDVVIPGFVVSELRTAFQMGFVIYIPFLIIDMVVASTLMAMGMMMLPPVLISETQSTSLPSGMPRP